MRCFNLTLSDFCSKVFVFKAFFHSPIKKLEEGAEGEGFLLGTGAKAFDLAVFA